MVPFVVKMINRILIRILRIIHGLEEGGAFLGISNWLKLLGAK